jgi:hypothetical protein
MTEPRFTPMSIPARNPDDPAFWYVFDRLSRQSLDAEDRQHANDLASELNRPGVDRLILDAGSLAFAFLGPNRDANALALYDAARAFQGARCHGCTIELSHEHEMTAVSVVPDEEDDLDAAIELFNDIACRRCPELLKATLNSQNMRGQAEIFATI